MKGRDGTELRAYERNSKSNPVDSATSRTSSPLASSAPSLLDLGLDDDNNTMAIPSGELTALLAETQDQSKRVTSRPAPMVNPASSSEIRQRKVPLHAVPEFPEEPSLEESAVIESNLHQIDRGRIVDSLAPSGGLDEDLDLPVDLEGVAQTADPSPQATRPPIVRFFMVALAIAAVLQIAATLSEITGVTWLDPRPIMIAAFMLAKEAVSSIFSKLPSP